MTLAGGQLLKSPKPCKQNTATRRPFHTKTKYIYILYMKKRGGLVGRDDAFVALTSILQKLKHLHPGSNRLKNKQPDLLTSLVYVFSSRLSLLRRVVLRQLEQQRQIRTLSGLSTFLQGPSAFIPTKTTSTLVCLHKQTTKSGPISRQNK